MKDGSWPRWASPVVAAVGAAALVVHARRFGFVCDDAYITLRYAKNLAAVGAPVYNLGERVEGYTNFLWMLLAALGFKAGLDVPGAVLALGAISALVLMVGVLRLWRGFPALPRWLGIVAVVLVAMTAPVAVWTLGGLETCLYAGLLAVSCALGASSAATGSARTAALTGASLALATLTRPEGAAEFAVVLATVALFRMRREGARATVGSLLFGYAILVVPHLVWRRSYYGDWLPNTYYAKIGIASAEMHEKGVAYLRLWASDFGWAAGLMAIVLVAPTPRALPEEPEEAVRSRRASVWLLRLSIAVVAAFAVWAGGDFLGAYRFLVPALPLVLVLVVAFAAQWAATLRAAPPGGSMVAPRVRWAIGATGSLLVTAYAVQQHRLWAVLDEGSKLDEPPAALEGIRYTRLYAQQWAALGRWIAEHAKVGDWMAEGAAGASPYYAGINNLDLYGLNDRYVARHGMSLGNKPGHQRWAPKEYVAQRRPVFLFDSVARITEEPEEFGRDGWWERQGYVSVRARIDQRYGIAQPYYVNFLMRRDRALVLKNDPSLSLDAEEY
jgi:hypothetical protein